MRVVDYHLKDVEGSEPLYRLITTLLDHQQAPAKELAALYQRAVGNRNRAGRIENTYSHAQIVLRSKTPELVRQEFFGLLMTHFAVRSMHEVRLERRSRRLCYRVPTWHEDFRKDLTPVDVPTLVIHGEADRILPIDASGRRTAKTDQGRPSIGGEGRAALHNLDPCRRSEPRIGSFPWDRIGESAHP